LGPSWGPEGLLENFAEQTVSPLLNAGLIVLRLHIRTRQLNGDKIKPIISLFSKNPLFSLDLSTKTSNSFLESDVLVTACSGIALEYALAQKSPSYQSTFREKS
jgi:hypothetical protein